jgi:signal transduction histidine kinase
MEEEAFQTRPHLVIVESMTIGPRPKQMPRLYMAVASLLFVLLVGIVDYHTGFEVSFSVFYLFAVVLATWYVGRNYGLAISFLSVVVWTAGDLVAGARFSNPIIPVWNAAIFLAFYSIAVLLLTRLRALNRELEERVKQRTLALTTEMTERGRLEKEIIEISEREQRRIGHDLHDSLCQHLTGTALAGRVLQEKLAAKSSPEAADAAQIVNLVEEGILQARNLARGIMPVDMDSEGFMAALADLARTVTARARLNCVFTRDAQVLVANATSATHLYRITQEAISNAIRHGKPQRIDVNLAVHDGCTTLTIEDDGAGLPDGWQHKSGLGTRIMAHRAAMIGGRFSIEPNPTGGTSVRCAVTSQSLA